MKLSMLITLLVVGGSGLAAFILAYGFFGQQPDASKGKISVLSATQPMRRGDTLELAKNCEFKLVHETDLPEDALVEDAKLREEIGQKKVFALAAITRNDLFKRSTAGSNMSGVIEHRLKDKPGFRAMTIPASTDKSVAGFIKPGSYVDLLWSGQPQGKKVVTMFLMSNIEVAAVDLENTVAANQAGSGKEVRYLTFIMSVEDSQRLTFAKDHGTVTATLRGTANEAVNSKPLKEVDWVSFMNMKQRNQGATEAEIGAEERKSLEKEGLALVDMVESALNLTLAASNAPTKRDVPFAVVSSKPKKVWYMFEVKNVDGKTMTRVPIEAESEFARKNPKLLREPEPDELEAINEMVVKAAATEDG